MIRYAISLISILLWPVIARSQQIIQGPPRIPTVSGGVDCSSLNTNLIAYWKFDEASGQPRADSSGSGLTLTDNNTVGTATGKINNAASLAQAGNDYFSRATEAALETGDIDWEITGWFQIASTNTTRYLIAKWEGTGNQREYYLRYLSTSDRMVFAVSNDGTASVTVTANNAGKPEVNTWHWFDIWHDASANTINIAIDNGTPNSTAHATGVFVSTAAFQIGRFGSTTSNYWDGLVDEVAFHKKILSSAERACLYNSGAALTCCPF